MDEDCRISQGAHFMDLRPWRVERKRILFSHPRVVLTEEAVRLPDGSLVENYLQITIAEHVAIIARSDEGKFLVCRQYKHGPRAVGLTFPAGAIEPGEEPSEAARRELREETGIAARNWRRLGRFVLNGNQGAGAVHLFFAQVADAVDYNPKPTRTDLEEQEILWLTEDKLIEASRCGQFRIASHALALAFALDRRLWPANGKG
jgi:ADP-ribose pyrophosphatase